MASESLQSPGNTEVLQYGSTLPEEPTPVELILWHAVTSKDQQLVCTIAMVCKKWRAATQTAAAGRLHVSLGFDHGWAPRDDGLPSSSMRKLFSFAQWLPKHAQIISKLQVSDNWDRLYATDKQRECSIEWLHNVAEPALGLALRGAAIATASHGATQLQAPGLQSYSSYGAFGTSAVLNALPATSLTELVSWDVSALATALPRLPNLQRLRTGSLRYTCGSMGYAEELLQLGQLATLQNLALSNTPEYDGIDQVVAASLAWPQLRQLKDIQLECLCPVAACLDLVQNLSTATQLTRLDVDFMLKGSKGQETSKVAICHELASLKMLRELSFDCYDGRGQFSCVQSDFYHLSRLTNLTKLEICSRHVLKGQEVFDDPAVAKFLLHLKHLEELCVPIRGVTLLPVIAHLTNLKKWRCLEHLASSSASAS